MKETRVVCVFFFNDTATTEIYTLSLHDALPIYGDRHRPAADHRHPAAAHLVRRQRDRKSTRLNSSHANISYAVFCLKKNERWVPDPRSTAADRGRPTPPVGHDRAADGAPHRRAP